MLYEIFKSFSHASCAILLDLAPFSVGSGSFNFTVCLNEGILRNVRMIRRYFLSFFFHIIQIRKLIFFSFSLQICYPTTVFGVFMFGNLLLKYFHTSSLTMLTWDLGRSWIELEYIVPLLSSVFQVIVYPQK